MTFSFSLTKVDLHNIKKYTIMENTIYKELAKYHYLTIFDVMGFPYQMNSFTILKNLQTKKLSIKVFGTLLGNTKQLSFDYSTEEFENEFKINLADIIDFPLT